MKTTKDLPREKEGKPKPLKFVTTKDIEVKYLGDDEKPLEPAKKPMVTTHNIHIMEAKAKKEERARVEAQIRKQRAEAEKKKKKKEPTKDAGAGVKK